MAALDRMSLYPFQKEGIAFATNREASLIADDMGLRKTVQAIGLINEDASVRRVLVVCPQACESRGSENLSSGSIAISQSRW